MDFAESAGAKSKQEVFGVYGANYYFNDKFYGFALGRIKADDLTNTLDAFLGFGPGYRIVNTPDLTWRLQAGVGVSYLEQSNGTTTTEVGYIASSRVYRKFPDTIFATNDTDILNSDTALRVNNDLGVNFKMTDKMATRVSYLSEYNDSRSVKSENKLGLALVFGFGSTLRSVFP